MGQNEEFQKQESIVSMRAGKGTERRLAFLNFYNETNSQEYQYLETAVGDAVYEATNKKYSYSRIDKAFWERYARGNRFAPVDFFDRGKIQIMGEAIPVDGVVFGKFAVTKEQIKISARVLSVSSHEVIAEAETVISVSNDISKELQSFSERLAGQVAELFVPSDRGAIWRSAVLPGWGQIHKKRRMAGYIYGGSVGTGFAFSLFSLIMWQTAYSRYRNYNPDHVITPQGGTELIDPTDAQTQFNRYASQTQTWQQITYISAGITFAIYLWQIVDAWIFDTPHAQLGKRIAAKKNDVYVDFGASHESPMQNRYYSGSPQGFSLAIGFNF